MLPKPVLNFYCANLRTYLVHILSDWIAIMFPLALDLKDIRLQGQ